MPIKNVFRGVKFTSRTYIKKVNKGFAPQKIKYDVAVTVPVAEVRKAGKYAKRKIKKHGIPVAVVTGGSYIGTRFAISGQNKRRKRGRRR